MCLSLPPSSFKDFRALLLFALAQNRFAFLRRLAKISAPHYFSRSSVSQGFLRGSQSRMRLGKENKPGLVFFSLSFVFGRFESKLSSGLQLRIKNQANLFYLRSPFTTFVSFMNSMEKLLQHIARLQERMQCLSQEMEAIRLEMNELTSLCEMAIMAGNAASDTVCEAEIQTEYSAVLMAAVSAETLADETFAEEDKLETPIFFEKGLEDENDLNAEESDFEFDEIDSTEAIETEVYVEEATETEMSVEAALDEAEAEIKTEIKPEPEAALDEPESEPELEFNDELEAELEAETEAEAETEPEPDPEIESESIVMQGQEFAEGSKLEFAEDTMPETLAESLAQERPDSLAERYEKQLAQKRLQNTLAAQRYADFSRALSLNDRFRYQRELFNNNREALSQLLAALDSMETWAEAEDYLSSYQWDEELPVVQEFYAMIEQHFNQ